MPFKNKVFQLIIETKITALPWLKHAHSFVCDRTTMSHNESLLRKLVEVKCFILAKNNIASAIYMHFYFLLEMLLHRERAWARKFL